MRCTRAGSIPRSHSRRRLWRIRQRAVDPLLATVARSPARAMTTVRTRASCRMPPASAGYAKSRAMLSTSTTLSCSAWLERAPVAARPGRSSATRWPRTAAGRARCPPPAASPDRRTADDCESWLQAPASVAKSRRASACGTGRDPGSLLDRSREAPRHEGGSPTVSWWNLGRKTTRVPCSAGNTRFGGTAGGLRFSTGRLGFQRSR